MVLSSLYRLYQKERNNLAIRSRHKFFFVVEPLNQKKEMDKKKPKKIWTTKVNVVLSNFYRRYRKEKEWGGNKKLRIMDTKKPK